MSNAQDFIALEEQYGAHNYHPLDVVITRAEGAWVWDVDGKKYMDFLAAYSAVNQGHCHPRLVKVMEAQMRRVALTSRAFRNDQLGPFCKEICELTGFDRVLPMNTGAEAVETAIKAARKWGYTVKGIPEDQAEILVFAGNFLEHLDEESASLMLDNICRALKIGGHLILLQPNYRLCPESYFDDETHQTIFSDHNIREILIGKGFEIRKLVPGFLPFSMKSSLPKAPILVRLYLMLPFRPLAAQMYVVAQRR